MYLEIFILGLIEGITEFLPVSSTGHLIIAAEYLGLNFPNQSYEIIIQLAAIFAVLIFYHSKFKQILSLTDIKQSNIKIKDSLLFKYCINLLIAFIPIGLVGLILHQYIKQIFSIPIVAWMFIIGGIIILVIEYWFQSKAQGNLTTDIDKITKKQALYIGIAQVFALIPGTSRAGASIMGGLLVGLNRKTSAEFSFFLAIPVVGAASAFDLLKNYQALLTMNVMELIFGFIVAFITSLLVIKLLLGILNRFSFVGFGVYRIIFGTILLVVFS